MLAKLCSFSQEILAKNPVDNDNEQLTTIYLLTEEQVQSNVNATIETFRTSLSIQMVSFLNYLRIIMQANFFISALSTNVAIAWVFSAQQYTIDGFPITYDPATIIGSVNGKAILCSDSNPISPASFLSLVNTSDLQSHALWYPPNDNSTLIDGFYAACTPLEALLASTLDCLYDIGCLHLLVDHFPSLNQVLH